MKVVCTEKEREKLLEALFIGMRHRYDCEDFGKQGACEKCIEKMYSIDWEITNKEEN